MGLNVRFKVDENHNVQEIHKVVVHRFTVMEHEDPEIYAAGPLYTWEKSEPGQFVMAHALDKPIWHKQLDSLTLGYRFAIIAELEKKKLSEFYLRFGKINA